MGGHLILSVAIGEMAFASDVRQRNLLLRAAHSELCCWCGARVLLQLRGRLGRRSRGLQVAARRAANHAHAAAEPDGLALLGDEVKRAADTSERHRSLSSPHRRIASQSRLPNFRWSGRTPEKLARAGSWRTADGYGFDRPLCALSGRAWCSHPGLVDPGRSRAELVEHVLRDWRVFHVHDTWVTRL